ncbi:heptosyltransferase-2 [Thermodesulfobium acidiphilum]|uniref:Heptosyltransferase-2 n=1 Tax=Thermodesulfobium acidiphilum TaxID=1794699 RepID=A0A2R4VYJ2_THEAF|nr:glycosyltransferase family 9 protein [Thermodesulfobium acidiphilum]AWB09506.1 heptosyltransferase-2 [Thermodesulfobium acidiphilum]
MTLPVFFELENLFPKAQFDILVGERSKEIFLTLPNVDEVFLYTSENRGIKGKIPLIKDISKKKYDLVIDLRHSILPIFVRSKQKIFTTFKPKIPGIHATEEHLRNIFHKDAENFKFDYSDKIIINNKTIIKFGDVLDRILGSVGIVPGATWQPKAYRIDGFVEASKMLRNKGLNLVLLGSSDEVGLCDEISKEVESLNLCGKTSLMDLFYIIKNLSALVTNDSGPMHIASLLNIPTVALFGPSDERRYRPWGKRYKVLMHKEICRECLYQGCDKGGKCMNLITPDEIVDATINLIGALI